MRPRGLSGLRRSHCRFFPAGKFFLVEGIAGPKPVLSEAQRSRTDRSSQIEDVLRRAGTEPAGAVRRRREARTGELAAESESIEPARKVKAPLTIKPERDLEAGAGIEPANSGFADRSLTTWLPRRLHRAVRLTRSRSLSKA